jgi:hypothetical protein
VSRWTRQEQAGYRLETLSLTGGSAGGGGAGAGGGGGAGGSASAGGVLSGMGLGLLGSGGGAGGSAPSQPRIQLEIEFLPYW